MFTPVIIFIGVLALVGCYECTTTQVYKDANPYDPDYDEENDY